MKEYRMKKLAVFGRSAKKHEKRIAIHPDFLDRFPSDVREYMYFEKGYGEAFGISDAFFEQEFGGVLERESLYTYCDVWLLPKPTTEDFKYFDEGKVLWGWPHCVQGKEITQVAIDKKMTIIAWEAMYGGNDNTHIFYRNNELAGYAAVQHMMMLSGKNGFFGKRIKACVLGFGATARGAISSLKSLGINDISVYSKRPSYLINAPVESVDYKQMKLDGNNVVLEADDGQYIDSHKALEQYDVIINCVLQNPTDPLMFIRDESFVDSLDKQIDIIDISCDEGMGFYFAKPTDFDEPAFTVKNKVHYYCVDHTPTIYWKSASYEITKSIFDYIPMLVSDSWKENKTLLKALEIENGRVVNRKILDFQQRGEEYPHDRLA